MTHKTSECLFCKFARGDIRPHVVHEDDRLLAFLDIGPIRRGHVQIIPRAHYDYFEMLPEDLAADILALGQKIARVQKRLYGVPRVAFLFSGGDIAHAHAHLVPMVEGTDITSRRYIREETLSFAAIPSPPPAELAEVALEIRGALERDEAQGREA